MPEGSLGTGTGFDHLMDRLGGVDAVGSVVRTKEDLMRVAEAGLPVAAADALSLTTLSKDELFRLVLPRRTYAHRKAQSRPLSSEETERALRVARIAALSEETFGDRDVADRWLRRPTRALGGRAPLDLVVTEPGGELVEDLLMRIAHGMAA